MRDKKLPTVIFGQVLQELRLGHGLTQDRLAELANTERSHISALERAEKGPALATIFSLADALAIPAGELIALVESRLRSAEKKR
jgi:transcriptional regulator with XRE-family HTH domain